MKTTIVRDRRSDSLYQEYVDPRTRVALTLSNYLPASWVNKLSQVWTNSCSSKYNSVYSGLETDIRKFIEEYKVDMNEIKYPDITHYKTYNEWFQRELKEGSRPIDGNPASIVSPADCRMRTEINDLMGKGEVKGTSLYWKDILKEAYTEIHNVSTVYYCRLAYQDYHRFHMPVGGVVRGFEMLGSTVYPVNSLYTNKNVLKDNIRCVLRVHTPGIGIWLMVLIGASCVGSILLKQKVKDQLWLGKGEELGMFGLGGSAILVIFPYEKVKPAPDLVSPFIETVVKVGESIGKM